MGTRLRPLKPSPPATVPHVLDVCAGRYRFIDAMPMDRAERRAARLERRDRERRIYQELKTMYASVAEADKIYDPTEKKRKK